MEILRLIIRISNHWVLRVLNPGLDNPLTQSWESDKNLAPLNKACAKAESFGSTAASCWRMDGFQCHTSSLGCGIWVQLVTFIHTSAPEKPPHIPFLDDFTTLLILLREFVLGELLKCGDGDCEQGITTLGSQMVTESVQRTPPLVGRFHLELHVNRERNHPQKWEKWWTRNTHLRSSKHSMPLGIEYNLRQYLHYLALFISTRMLEFRWAEVPLNCM